MAVDKCAIAKHAHEYLAADYDHWGKGAFVRDTDEEIDYDDHADAYDHLNEQSDCAVCLVGAYIYGFWAVGAPVVIDGENELTPEFKEVINKLDAHVVDKTSGMWSSAIGFNDDGATVYSEVVAMTRTFAEEVCE